MEILNLENALYLNTKVLTEEEKKDRLLDYLGGFSLIDSEMRLFVIEGLGGRGNSIAQFYKINELTRPNDKKFKMLYNPNIKFKDRLYQEFNCSLRKIKLRDSLG